MVTKTEPSTRIRYYNGGVTKTTGSETLESWNVPALQQGIWKDFGNGFRFRMPTDYSRYHLSLTRANRMKSEGYRLIGTSTRYNYGRETSEGGYGFGNFFSGNWVYRYDSGIGIPSIQGAPALVADEKNEAVTKALNKIADQKVNLGENLATLGQTCRMIISPLQSFVGLAKSYHSLPLGREIPWAKLARMSYRELVSGRVGSKIADRYLEYVYGFKPLMQDIYEISELAKSQAKAPLLFNGRASAKRSGSAPTQHFDNISVGQDEYWENAQFKSMTRTTLWAKLKDEYALLRTLNQLGLVNPAALVWELVPFSFVIDWALPIGPVLNAMTAPAGLDFVGGSTSRRVTAAWDYSIYDKPPGDKYFFNSTEPATGRMRYEGYKRERITQWPRPGLWFASDPLGLHRDGSDRSIKGLALAIAALPRSL